MAEQQQGDDGEATAPPIIRAPAEILAGVAAPSDETARDREEPEGAGLAAGQAALLAAIAGRIEASEQRQEAARREQLPAFEARLARATAGANPAEAENLEGTEPTGKKHPKRKPKKKARRARLHT